MPKKKKRFADDGWAIWIEGDDTSNVYINDWMDPKGKSYVDFAVRVKGVSVAKNLYVYVPFAVSKNEIEDISLMFNNRKILQAIFSSACIIDYKKNAHTSEVAYNGKTIDIIHISTIDYEMKTVGNGTRIGVNLPRYASCFDNDEVYLIWRMPHKSLDEVFKPRVDMGNVLQRFQDLITTPVVSEKYGYSVRVNEAGLLPEEITSIGSFHRQKLNKAVITISINESYELNDSGCYTIRRLEEELYKDYLPKDFSGEDVITYQWNQSRDYNMQGRFSFYYQITRESVKQGSMFIYLILLLFLGAMGEFLADAIRLLFQYLT